MSNAVKCAFVFAVGAAIGSTVTWKLLKNKYERIAQEEIDSVKEVFSRRLERANDELDPLQYAYPETMLTKESDEECEALYEEQVRKYKSNSDVAEKEIDDKPYVIPPELFGEMDEYEKISLNYYSDFVLTDELNEPVDDVDDVVGLESLDSFGEYEDDCVYVRNNRLKCDYEILWREKRYSDVIREKPHRVEG